MPEAAAAKHNWHLDKRFTVGNLLTMVTIIVAVLAWVYKLDQRMALLEQSVIHQKEIHERDKQATASQYQDIKSSLLRIENKLDNKADKRR
ncbi:MAG: hypothetical protein OEY78_12725 [Gammaproteobacteria bacterium]|nr:hypothetical protein [Gammaproteobacteria bacterium]